MSISSQHAKGVRVAELSKSFGKLQALRHVSLEIRPGEFFALLGPSGCGKTTLMRAIAGLLDPEVGRIEVDGVCVVDAARRHFLSPDRRQLGMVFQDYALWPHMRVRENVAFPLAARKVPAAQHAMLVGTALRRVALEHLAQRFPAELSGGQQQRVAVARAIVGTPKVLLFDEPLSNLDANLRETLGHELAAVARETGATSVYVTHDQSEALGLADRVAVMRNGEIVQLDTPLRLYRQPASAWVARFLNAGNLLPGKLETHGFSPDGVATQVTFTTNAFPNARTSPGDDKATLFLPSAAIRPDPAGAWVLTVRAAHFHGDRFQIDASWGTREDAPLVNFWHDEELPRGSTVRVTLDMERLRLFTGDAASID